MSADYIHDFVVGYLYDDWSEMDQKLSGKPHTDDSGLLEAYAETLQAKLILLNDGGALFGIDYDGSPLSDESVCFNLKHFQSVDIEQKLEALRKKLTSTGFPPEGDPMLVMVREYCG